MILVWNVVKFNFRIKLMNYDFNLMFMFVDYLIICFEIRIKDLIK